MAINPELNHDTTLSSFGDDSLESRFSLEQKKLFLNKIENFESLLFERSYNIAVHFHGQFDVKSRKAIQNLVNEVFHNAESHELMLHYTDPEVHFYTVSNWEKTNQAINRKKINLPASKIRWENKTPHVELIIPEKLSTSEEVIKTVRLLFSKLFGKLYFSEHVPRKSAYTHIPNEQDLFEFDKIEKASLCKILDRFNSETEKEFEKIARKIGIRGPKLRELGKNEFFRELEHQETNQDINKDYLEVLEKAFQFLIGFFNNDPNGFYDELTDKVFALTPQTTLLLPYDLKKFLRLKEQRQWLIFHAFNERLQLVVNYIEELQECWTFLDNKKLETAIDYQIADSWLKTLEARIISLKKKGLIKLFLTEGAKLTPKQAFKLKEFPLWIWRNNLFEIYPKGIKPEKLVKKISDQYKNSVYQKLFETSFRLINSIKEMKNNSSLLFNECDEFKRLKSSFTWFDIRQKTLINLLYSCKVGTQVSAGIKNKKRIHKQDILNTYEQGWSYFISFAMVHQYFLNSKGKTKQGDLRSQQFFSVIENFVLKRLNKLPSYQVSYLFLKIYEQRKFNLQHVIKLLKDECQIIDFFILNQKEIVNNPSKDTQIIINSYSDSILQWDNQRTQQKIQDYELESIRSKAKSSS